MKVVSNYWKIITFFVIINIGDNMNKVQILFENYKYKLVMINIDSKLMSIDEKIIHITDDDITNFKQLLIHLEDKNNKNNIIDPARYYIDIYYNDKTESYNGNSRDNKFLLLFNDWIGEINARSIN